MSTCINCSGLIKPASSVIRCDGCQNSIHPACVGLTESDVVVTRAKSRAVKVVCNTCNGNMSQFKDIKSLMTSLKTEFCTALAELKNEFNDKFVALRAECLKQLASGGSNNVDFEEVVGEVQERQSRKLNVIMFGLPEPSSDSRGNATDSEEVSMVLRSVAPSLDVSTVNSHRLGRLRPGADRPRPVKIVLRSEDDVRTVIRNANKLRETPRFSRIYVSYDKTARQIELYKDVKRQLDERVAGGEKNIRIKYMRGIPKIVPLN